MTSAGKPKSFSIGWDVGAWNCDKNPDSRDAIVILDSTLAIVGQPWRGNLRECISGVVTTTEWLNALFSKCKAGPFDRSMQITMAIDTPLGFSEEFLNLAANLKCVESVGSSASNRYLFRRTERHLFQQGLKPLSAVKDMIGSQATKGMHALARFAPTVESCGVWTDGKGFRAIETYPTACRKTWAVKSLLVGRKSLDNADKDDALICALIAHLFATNRQTLEAPSDDIPVREGWIWVPQDK